MPSVEECPRNRTLRRLAVSICLVCLFDEHARTQEYSRYSAPEMFNYDELVALSEDQELSPVLAEKLDRITTTPFVSNEAHYRGARPHRPEVDRLGPSLRVVFWNIERGLHLDEIILLLTDASGFVEKAVRASSGEGAAETSAPIDSDDLRAELDLLAQADVIVLNEVDWGVKRTGYRAVIRELGDALKMNWAYGVEFLEIDPTQLGLAKLEDIEDEQEREALLSALAVDPEQLRALHGTAILSRYPIREARLRPFAFQPYDWYEEEKALRPTEKGIRAGARVIGEEMHREMRRGGRIFLAVDLDVPELPEGRLTVASPHLENRTKPKNRRIQMEEVLESVRDVRNPVVIAGDLNTTTGDSQAFRLERELFKKYGDSEFWVNTAVKYGTGVGLVYDVFKWGFRFTHNLSDPTAQHLPFFAPNHEEKLFTTLENFRFEDGMAFDFRGIPERAAMHRGGTLADSNQRESKGFAHTYEFVISVGAVGNYKLDWIFVKSYLRDPRNADEPFRFAPHFARTLRTLNYALETKLSDHNPMIVDLPFEEPQELSKE